MSNICDWCNNRLMRLIPKYWRRDYIVDSREILSINAEAENGCKICRLLRENLVALQVDIEDDKCHVMTVAVPTLDQRQFTLRFRYSLSLGAPSKVFTFCLQDNSWMLEGPIDTTVSRGFQARRAGALAFLPTRIQDTRQDECIQRIRGSISRCKNQHPDCSHQGLACSHLPSRVIEVGYPAKLYESQGERAPYITLSHCWGTSQHFVTTSENIQDLLAEIPWRSLPKTFQDAILITRSLGIRFLWIDSLCIIQDKRSDWELELAKMGDNYKNSFLTIAAASAVDDQAGFLGPRGTTNVLRDLPPISGIPAGLMVREVPEEVGGCQQPEMSEPLYTRGWVLQERLLSPRVLSFGSTELRWDCNTSTFAETGHSPPKDTQIAYRRDFFRVTANNSNSQPPAEKEHDMSAIYDWWHQSLVPAYTKLKLTKQDGKLPALSAISEEVRLRTGDVYLAGLWKRDLHRGLLWMCQFTGRLPDKYRAPSWSWASIEPSSIISETVNSSQRLDARILDAQFGEPRANDLERVPSGYIRAEGLCFEATLEASLPSESLQRAARTRTFRFHFQDHWCIQKPRDSSPTCL